jgi:hypothetical protein
MAWSPDHLSVPAAAFVESAKTQIANNPEWLDVTAPV